MKLGSHNIFNPYKPIDSSCEWRMQFQRLKCLCSTQAPFYFGCAEIVILEIIRRFQNDIVS